MVVWAQVGANATNHAFSTDLAYLYAERPAVRLWCYGHTHFNNDRMVGGMRMLSNQRGYRDNRCAGWRDDHGVPIGEVVAEAPRASRVENV